MTYLVLKWVHIISSTLLFGTGLGSAFLMFVANRRGNPAEIAVAVRHVVLADWVFTTPSGIVQLATGLALLHVAGYSFSDFWVAWALALFVFAMACWLPVVWMQIKMRDMAEMAVAHGTALPAAYWRYDRWWIALGCLAFPAMVAIFWLMIARPVG